VPDLLIRRVPDAVLSYYRERAKIHGCSMQQELLETLKDGASEVDRLKRRRRAIEAADKIRMAILRDRGGRPFSDSVELIREDRES
jgi:plasmid stability protein